VASIERTAYPRFKRVVSARELHTFFTPSNAEALWAAQLTRSDEHLLALVLALKCYQRMAHFPRQVPDSVVEHVRRALAVPQDVGPVYDSDRTASAHRALIRERVGAKYEPAAARAVAGEAIRAAALRKNNPPDLINIALEQLVHDGYELPGYTTLDEMAAAIRREVNDHLFATIWERIRPGDRLKLDLLLEVPPGERFSPFDRLKKTARRATWTTSRSSASTWTGWTASG
jgi:hypothetical protein